MKREFLKELGLEDSAIDAIMTENGKDVERYKMASETLKTEKESLTTQLSEANKQIEEFQGMDIDSVKQAAKEWEEKYTQAQADAEARIKEMEFDSLLSDKLSGLKFTSEYAKKGVYEEIKQKGLTVENGSILGFDDVLKSIQEQQPAAFESDEAKPKFVSGTSGTANTENTDSLRAAMGLPATK